LNFCGQKIAEIKTIYAVMPVNLVVLGNGTLSADSTAEKNLQQSKEFWISGLSESKVNLSHFLE
jgi:hypothetical protein